MTLREWFQAEIVLAQQDIDHLANAALREEALRACPVLERVLRRLEARHAPCLEAPVAPDDLPGTAHGILCALAQFFVAVASTQLDIETFAALYEAAGRRLREE